MVDRAPLERRLPPRREVSPDALLEGFLGWVEEIGVELYPAQEEAILEVFAGNNVILATPTGSGKSMVALAACFKAIAEDEVAFYTAPIKALVSEKFFDLCRVLGPDNVGMMTGDASVNADAPVVCCTAEILANTALREGSEADVRQVVMDEFHYYSDRDRGVAWQVPLLALPRARFLLMSATLGDTSFFETDLEARTDAPVALVKTAERPVPLDYEYRETPIHETIGDLLEAGKTPIYIVHFTQRAAAERAQNLMSIDFLSKEQKKQIKEEIGHFRFDSPFGKELKRWVPHGVGVHHAGMLPKYRRLVERLAQKGLLKIICGTDTLGVGVNIPIRTVLFTQLCKYDGKSTSVLTVRDFKQIAGRAGRKGFDDRGSVVAQAPEHHIENLSQRAKAAGDPKKLRKLKPKKPPERGYAHWDEQTFERLQKSDPERLESRFEVSHGMLLNVLAREDGTGCRAMKSLIRTSHEAKPHQRRHARTAIAMFRSLLDADIVSLVPGGAKVNADLQSDFSLNHALGLYVVEVVEVLDREDPDYALKVLSIVEAILETPAVVVRRQVDKLKTDLINRLKAEGVEYEERMAELEKVDAPKPEAEFLYGTFDAFVEHHPWVGADPIRPKSIARDMYENGLSFKEYIKEYGLARSEGVLLRYLGDAYKALVQTVPDAAKTDEVDDLVDWLGGEVRQVDASLLEEWELLRDPEKARAAATRDSDALEEEEDITRDPRAFTVLVRNAVWRVVQALARRDYARAVEQVIAPDGEDEWTAERFEEALAPYWAEYDAIRTDPAARSPRNLTVEPTDGRWRLVQSLVDPDEHLDWFLELDVDLAASREAGAAVVALRRIGR